MATSGSANFSITRDEIVTECLERLGILAAGETPTAADVSSLSTSLNLLVKALQTDNISLRFLDEQTLSLTDGVASYDLDSGTLRVMDAWLRIDNQDTHLNLIDDVTYDATNDKSVAGQPYAVFVDYAPTLPKLYCFPVPGDSYTLHYRRERSVEDFDAATDNPDFPVKAFEMLVLGLCVPAAAKFQLPIMERQYWEAKFEQEKNRYRAGDTQRHSRQIVAPRGVV